MLLLWAGIGSTTAPTELPGSRPLLQPQQRLYDVSARAYQPRPRMSPATHRINRPSPRI